VCLVKDKDRILEVYVKILSYLFINQIVVGHEDYISTSCSIFHRVVRAENFLFCLLVELFYVHGIPAQSLLACFPVFIVNARIEPLLHAFAASVESKSSGHVDA